MQGATLKLNEMNLRLALAFVLCLPGCTGPTAAPSLLPRAIETRPDTVAAPVAAPRAPLDPNLAAQLAALVSDAQAGDAEFDRAYAAGRTALASGQRATAGSEAWIAAQQVISALQAARQRSAAALSRIDSLTVARSELVARDATVGGLDDYRDAQAQAAAIVTRQTSRLDAFNR